MNTCRRHWWWLTLLWVTLSVHGQDQRWNVQRFDVRNGLPQSSVGDMVLDTMGFLWLTTEGGLVRYDGRHFRGTRLAPGNDLLTSRTRQLVLGVDGSIHVDDANGDLYAVHGHGVAIRMHSGGRRLHVTGRIPSLETFLALADTARIDPVPEQPRRMFMHTMDSSHWVIGLRGALLFHRTGRQYRRVALPTADAAVMALSGALYSWDQAGGLVRLDTATGRWGTAAVLVNGKPGTWPLGARLHLGKKDDHVYVQDGTALLDCSADGAGTVHLVDQELQLPQGTVVNCVLRIGETGTLAVGTSSKGLYLYRPQLVRTVQCIMDGQMENSFYAQADLGEQGLLTVGNGRLGIIMEREGCSAFPFGLSGLSYGALCKDAMGIIWYTEGDRLWGYDPQGSALVKTDTIGVYHPTLWAEGDSMWVADMHRLGYMKDRVMHWTAALSGSSYLDRPFVIRRLPDGRLAYGSCRGLFVATGSAADRFEPDERFKGLCVRSIEILAGMVFIGTYGGGARVIRGGQVYELPVDRQEALNHVHTFVLDDHEHLWMSTNKGLVRTTLADITTYLKDPQQRPFYAIYGANAGMLNPELNGGCEPGWLRLADGRLSFPSMDGLVQFNPDRIPDPYPSHPVVVGEVNVNGKRWPVDAYSIFPPSTLQVSIELAMAYWGEPENAKLEYRITGIQDTWAPLKLDQGFLIIDRPPSGEHEVFVRPLGSAARGVRDEALYWFRVEPPFWFTWPGILLQVVGFIGLLTLIWRVYTLRLRRRNRWLEENVKARTQELDHRNAQLTRALETRSALIATIGHDIITPLRFLARVARSTRQLSRTGVEPAELDRSLEDLGQSAEKLNANASALMDWVKFNPDHITPRLQAVDLGVLVRDVVELWQELADRSGIRIDVQVATGIQVHSDPHLLKVILNNLLGNAITHSGTNIGVLITFAKVPDGWELRLADTGAGIDADTLERLQQLLNAPHVSDPARFARGDGQGIGYVIVASMAQLLRASIRIDSHAEGTVISLIHPVA